MTAVIPCAIYTRKSSEDGLEQNFNSLDAQRESCAAYILSQKSAGWRLVETSFDDGGFSGGNSDRPALRKLIAELRAGRIRIVVVYKVDRLSRSLADFAKLMDVFDAHDASFVSVTQQFNTTTSMGRLTLNILLSFAQFEREVTGERIRDKISASKQKGMWMGGNPPIGYLPHERSLRVDAVQAERVREVFRMYLRIGNIPDLKKEIARLGWLTPYRVSRRGREVGNRAFSHGHIRNILQNPVYRGLIKHKGKLYQGNHPPIIDEVLWQSVKDRLSTLVTQHRQSRRKAIPPLLEGLVFNALDQAFTTRHIPHNQQGYGYYDCPAPTSDGCDGSSLLQRLPATQVDAIVVNNLIDYLRDRDSMSSRLADVLSAGSSDEKAAALARVLERVRIYPEHLELLIRSSFDHGASGETIPETFSLHIPVRLRGRGLSMRRVVLPKSPGEGIAHPAIGELVSKAHDWCSRLTSGRYDSVQAIATEHKIMSTYVAKVIGLAFLAPDIALDLLSRQHPEGLTSQKLLSLVPLPASWAAQRALLRSMGWSAH